MFSHSLSVCWIVSNMAFNLATIERHVMISGHLCILRALNCCNISNASTIKSLSTFKQLLNPSDGRTEHLFLRNKVKPCPHNEHSNDAYPVIRQDNTCYNESDDSEVLLRHSHTEQVYGLVWVSKHCQVQASHEAIEEGAVVGE